MIISSPMDYREAARRRLPRFLFDYIEQDNPQAAIDTDERISVRVDGLRQFPESGRPGRVEGTRELVINRVPCRGPTRSRNGDAEMVRRRYTRQFSVDASG